MKILHRMLGFVSAIAMILVVLITSFEIGIYSDFGWYQKEYEKYKVVDDLEMQMEDVMDVTTEMMAYLRGNREDLVVNTKVNGVEREFFNDREKAHMVDVKNLFLGGLKLRAVSIVIVVLAVGAMIAMKADWKVLLPKSCLIGLGTFVVLTGGLGMLCASDFNKYFTIFHEIFFTNDLWLLDWRTDLMIRMLPEGFFFDMVIRIGSIFMIALFVLLAASIFAIYRRKKIR